MKNLLSKRKIAYCGLQIPPIVVVKIIVAVVANEAIARLAKQQQQMRDAVVSSPYHNTRFLPKSNFLSTHFSYQARDGQVQSQGPWVLDNFEVLKVTFYYKKLTFDHLISRKGRGSKKNGRMATTDSDALPQSI